MEDAIAHSKTDEHGNTTFYDGAGNMLAGCGIVKPPERVQYEKFLHAAANARAELVTLVKVLVDEAFPGDEIAQVGQAIDTIDTLIKARAQE